MVQPVKKIEESALPDPELNPLLNPVLGAHMGRWAEVYFTSPPEKRGEAVSELLRELKGSSPEAVAQESTAQVEGSRATQVEKETRINDAFEREESHSEGQEKSEVQEPRVADGVLQMQQVEPEASEASLICSTCGHNNLLNQNFCGMCGMPMASQAADSAVDSASEVPASDHEASEGKQGGFHEDLRQYSDLARDAELHRDSEERNLENNSYSTLEEDQQSEPLWQFGERDVPQFAIEPEPVPYRYRVYVGSGLAILLAVLLYMAWRGTAAFSGPQSAASRAIPSAPPPAPSNDADTAASHSSEPAIAKSPAASPTSKHSENVLPTESSATSSKPSDLQPPPSSPSPKPSKSDAAKDIPKDVPEQYASTRTRASSTIARRGARAHAAPAVPAAATSPSAGEQNGEQELATAEKYLKSGAGARRDGNEAAQWLWKSVAKGNLSATMLLSDMYLRGDGIAKNCDQARLLLDAAARKGGKGAGERLRNLQAFGCQ